MKQTKLSFQLPYGFRYNQAYTTICTMNEYQQWTYDHCKSFWIRMYLLCWYNKPKHNYVHIWYKTIKQNKYLKHSLWAVYANSFYYKTPVSNDHPQIIYLYNLIKRYCPTEHLYKLFWVVYQRFGNLRLLADNYRDTYEKLFRKTRVRLQF